MPPRWRRRWRRRPPIWLLLCCVGSGGVVLLDEENHEKDGIHDDQLEEGFSAAGGAGGVSEEEENQENHELDDAGVGVSGSPPPCLRVCECLDRVCVMVVGKDNNYAERIRIPREKWVFGVANCCVFFCIELRQKKCRETKNKNKNENKNKTKYRVIGRVFEITQTTIKLRGFHIVIFVVVKV